MLVAGKSAPKFGGGQVIEPIHITIAGRATNKVSNKLIPVDEIVIKAAEDYITKNLRLDLEHVKIDVEIRPGSGDLQEVFKRAKETPISNDTSFGVAHAPLSETENMVLKMANLINSKEFQEKFPAAGDDIKVMSLRKNNEIKLTISIPMIDKFISSLKEYNLTKEKISAYLLGYAKKLTNKKISIDLNSLDDPKAEKEADIYLTVTGFSAENGDDGQVGRGNRVNGLITPNRTMSLEAAAGKNISHPGKLYQVLAQVIADKIAKLEKVKEVYVSLLSEIGKPLDQPQIANVEILPKNNDDFENVLKEAEKIVNEVLDNLKKIQIDIATDKYKLF